MLDGLLTGAVVGLVLAGMLGCGYAYYNWCRNCAEALARKIKEHKD